MEVVNKILEMFPVALGFAVPLIITALGGLYSERSGVVNIALDGCMQVGAFTAVTVLLLTKDSMPKAAIWISLAAAAIAGVVFVSIHGYASIHMRADQTISGTALNVLAGGLTIYLCTILFGSKSTPPYSVSDVFQKVSVPLLSKIPVIGDLLFKDQYPFTYFAYILAIVTWFVVYKTPFGLRLRSCGEFPQASASMGVSVEKTRWAGVLISGCLAAIGGVALVYTTQTYFYNESIHSLGFIAIATLIFGKWNPWGVLGAGLLFGFAQTLGYYATTIPFLSSIPTEFFSMFPYVLTIIVIVLNGKQVGPKASGQIYDPSRR